LPAGAFDVPRWWAALAAGRGVHARGDCVFTPGVVSEDEWEGHDYFCVTADLSPGKIGGGEPVDGYDVCRIGPFTPALALARSNPFAGTRDAAMLLGTGPVLFDLPGAFAAN